MTSIRVNKHYFSGLAHVQSAGTDGLAAIIRNMAIDNARNLVNGLSPGSVTDNSGGTAMASIIANGIIVPSGVSFDATSGGGVQTAAFNTSLGKLRNAEAAWVATINAIGVKLGLPALSVPEGTGSANTIPAQDLTATTASGSSAVDYNSFVNIAGLAVANQQAIVQGANAVIKALGYNSIPGKFLNLFPNATTIKLLGNNIALYALPAATSSAAGPSSVLLADGTALLAALANNFATIASFWNSALSLSGPGTLTNSTGGTASSTLTLGFVNDNFTGHIDSSGDSASATALATIFAAYKNAFSSIQASINAYNAYEGVLPVLDSTGGTVSLTLAAESIAPSAGRAGVFASQVFTQTSTNNFINNDTLNLGGKTYTFQTALTNVDGHVLIGANFASSVAHLVEAVTLGANGGTDYAASTSANGQVTVTAGSGTFTVSALADGTSGNSLATVYTAAGTAAGSFGASTLAGGAAATSASLTSMDAAFNVIGNNIATLAHQIYAIETRNGLVHLTDNSAGANQGALVAIPALSTADNYSTPVGVMNTDAIAALTAVRTNIATLASALNTAISSTTFVAPISVVAG